MDNLFSNMANFLSLNSKLYNTALQLYTYDTVLFDRELDILHQLILDKLVSPIGRKDTHRLMQANQRDVNSAFWMFKSHPIKNFNAEVQMDLNRIILLELKALHRSQKYMEDFLKVNGLRVETDPFGSAELVADDDLNEREFLHSPIIELCKGGKKAVMARFFSSGTAQKKQRGEE